MYSSIIIDHGITGLISSDADKASIMRDETHEIEIRIRQAKQQAAIETRKLLEDKLQNEQLKQQKLWSNMETSFNTFIESAEKDINKQLIDMSIRIAEIIIRHELPDTSMLQSIIRDTLEPVSDLHGATVRMNPEDAKSITALRDGKEATALDHIAIIPDDSLNQGDVLMESRNGYFDGSISERLKLLDEQLKERYRNSNTGADERNS